MKKTFSGTSADRKTHKLRIYSTVKNIYCDVTIIKAIKYEKN